MAIVPDISPVRPTLARRLTVGVLAFAGAVQIVSSQFGAIATIAQKPLFALDLPFAHDRPTAMQAWQMAAAGAPKVQVVGLAGKANRGSPLIEPAFAAGALALGPDGSGGAWLDHAWRLSRRDPWLLQAMFARAHARRDNAGELAAIAALLLQQFDVGQMRETYLADLTQPAAFAQSVATLRAKPRWRRGFFSGLRVDPALQSTVNALIIAMRDGGAPLSGDEMAGLLGPLVYGDRANPAIADGLWRAWLGKGDPWAWAPSAGNGARLPFDWVMGDHAHYVDAKSSPVLGFDGNDTPGAPIATKPLYLPAGRYQFAARAGQGLSDAAISATLVCDSQRILLTNGATWQTDHACRTAELRLLANSAEGTIVNTGLHPLP